MQQSENVVCPGQRAEDAMGLYIHLPWCIRKCPYCDFNSHAASSEGLPENDYIVALGVDLKQDIGFYSGRRLSSIFLGGGTPSLFSAKGLEQIIDRVVKEMACEDSLEITLEANPGTFETEKFRDFRRLGINRLSIGVQSFQDTYLKALGRVHQGDEAMRAVSMARRVGFDNINIDLMYGLPEQTVAHAENDLAIALSLQPSHLSYYQLSLEPQTLFYRQPPSLPEADVIWAMQQSAQLRLQQNGFIHYEVSAYGQAGFFCRHNLNYWRFGDYLGIGAGAHGKISTCDESGVIQDIRRRWKVKHPVHYIARARQSTLVAEDIRIEKGHIPCEFLMNHLRLKQGFTVGDYRRRTGLSMRSLEPMLGACIADGLLEKKEQRICCTARGWDFLDSVLERFVVW